VGNKIEMNDLVSHVACMGFGRGVYILVGKHEGKRTLGKPRRRSEDNIKLYLHEYGLDRAGSG